MKFTSHTRQKFLNAFTLRLSQLFFDLFRRYPIRDEVYDVPPPFFIIGSGRSGTTLLRSFLFNHDLVDIPPETDASIPNSVKMFYRYGGLDWEDLVNVIVGEFCKVKTFEKWDIDVINLLRRLYNLPKEKQSLSTIIHIIYKEHIDTHKPNAERWGDKSPFNTLRLNWIDRLFPNAKYLNIVRDGRAVVSSYLKAELITNIDEAANRWLRSINEAEKFKVKKTENQLMTVYYEELVKDPDKVIKSVCTFLDLEYNDKLLKRNTDKLGDQDIEHMQNVKKTVFTDSIDKWKHELTRSQIDRLNNKLNPTLKRYGYET